MSGLLCHQGGGGSDFKFPVRTIGKPDGGLLELHQPTLFQNWANWFWFQEDFLYDALDDTEIGIHLYDHSPVGAPTKGLVANGTGGQLQLKCSNDNEAQTLALTMQDNLYLQGNKPFFFAARVKVVHTMAANQVVLVGLASGLATVPVAFDQVTRNLWFRLDGDSDLLVEADDNSTDTDDKDTGADITSGDWYWYVIERGTNGRCYFTLITDDGLMKTWTLDKFGVADPSFGANNLQPAVVVHKASGTTTPEVLIDAVIFGGAR